MMTTIIPSNWIHEMVSTSREVNFRDRCKSIPGSSAKSSMISTVAEIDCPRGFISEIKRALNNEFAVYLIRD